jgi:hypothetical protein
MSSLGHEPLMDDTAKRTAQLHLTVPSIPLTVVPLSECAA